MQNSEICVMYRDAKDKGAQVDILAQMNATDRDTIAKILKEGGYEVEPRKRRGGRRPKEDKSVTELKAAIEERKREVPESVLSLCHQRILQLATAIKNLEDDIRVMEEAKQKHAAEIQEIQDYIKASQS